jgi:uncharacterized protein
MTRFGLPAATLDALRRIFTRHPAVESVSIYGSRAKGTQHARSDIDLVAFGPGLDRFQIAAILLEIDDSDIPNLVDLQDFSNLRNPTLIDHIERIGQEIYRRPLATAPAPSSTPRPPG